mgnify:CR=1 FL=1
MRTVLGIDPGVKHTGWCVLKAGKPIARGIIIPPGEGKHGVAEVLAWVLPRMRRILLDYGPTLVAVEEVTWYGRGRRITLPLSHIAGALMALSALSTSATFVLLPGQKIKKRPRWITSKWSEHEADAALLALAAINLQELLSCAEPADTVCERKRQLAVSKRLISVEEFARGMP